MLEAFATRRDRRRSFLLFALCALLLGGAVAVTRTGFNPAGLRGLLAFLATCALLLAFTHPWKTPRKYVRLIVASAAGLAACIVLTNVFEGLAASWGDSGLLHGALDAAALVCFAGLLLLCPAGVLVGVLGVLATYRREGRPLLHRGSGNGPDHAPSDARRATRHTR